MSSTPAAWGSAVTWVKSEDRSAGTARGNGDRKVKELGVGGQTVGGGCDNTIMLKATSRPPLATQVSLPSFHLSVLLKLFSAPFTTAGTGWLNSTLKAAGEN